MPTQRTKSTQKPKVMPPGQSASVRSSVLSDDDEDGSRGRSRSARARRPQLTAPTSESTTRQPADIASSASGQTSTVQARTNKRRLLKVKDCLEQMVRFVEKHDLRRIIGRDLSNDQLRQQLLPQAKIAAKLPMNLKYVNRELVMDLAILSLYDMAVLIDDSVSMDFEETGKRKVAVKVVLKIIADVYESVCEKKRGIRAIRFLNGSDDLHADNIQTPEQIDELIDNHEFEGLTKIGTGLMQKILKPFVFEDEKWNKASKQARKLKKLERPLLIVVITDGAVEGEPPSRLRQAIQSVADSLQEAKFDPLVAKVIVFQFARVGHDRTAKKFLEHLHSKSSVKDYVDTLSGEDLMGVLADRQQQRMMKLLLGPISSAYAEMEDPTGYDSAEDFDDEENEDDFVDYGGDDDEDDEDDEDDDYDDYGDGDDL